MAKPVIFAVDLDPLVLRVPGSECLAESAGAGLFRRALSFWASVGSYSRGGF